MAFDGLSLRALSCELKQLIGYKIDKVFENVRPKNINNSYMNGQMFLNLAEMYINSLNSDELPNINTSWKIVIDSQMKNVYDLGLNNYMNEMNDLDYKNFFCI